MRLQGLLASSTISGVFAVTLATVLAFTVALSFSHAVVADGMSEGTAAQTEIGAGHDDSHLNALGNGQQIRAYDVDSVDPHDNHDLIKFLYKDWFLGLDEPR